MLIDIYIYQLYIMLLCRNIMILYIHLTSWNLAKLIYDFYEFFDRFYKIFYGDDHILYKERFISFKVNFYSLKFPFISLLNLLEHLAL